MILVFEPSHPHHADAALQVELFRELRGPDGHDLVINDDGVDAAVWLCVAVRIADCSHCAGHRVVLCEVGGWLMPSDDASEAPGTGEPFALTDTSPSNL